MKKESPYCQQRSAQQRARWWRVPLLSVSRCGGVGGGRAGGRVDRVDRGFLASNNAILWIFTSFCRTYFAARAYAEPEPFFFFL